MRSGFSNNGKMRIVQKKVCDARLKSTPDLWVSFFCRKFIALELQDHRDPRLAPGADVSDSSKQFWIQGKMIVLKSCEHSWATSERIHEPFFFFVFLDVFLILDVFFTILLILIVWGTFLESFSQLFLISRGNSGAFCA